MPDNSSTPTPIPDGKIEYSPYFAAKKVGWALASWKAAVPAGLAISPVAAQFIQKLSSVTSQFGISLVIDKTVFDSMLPIIIFAGIISTHDLAKIKFQDKPISKIL